MALSRDLSGVVFDLDGLMFNTEEVYFEVGTELLGRRNAVFTRDLQGAMMGRPAASALQVMIDWHRLSDTWQTLADESAEIYRRLLADHLAPMPGLLPLLAMLEKNELPKGIATSASRAFATEILDRFDMRERFRFVLTADDVREGKPDPEIYLKAAARLERSPQQVLVLEDSHVGIQSAAAAGAFAVAVPGSHSRTHDFSQAALVIDSLADPRLAQALGVSPA